MKIENQIKKLIKKSDNVFVSGHKNLDLDAIGACIGIKSISECFNKKCYIIVDDLEHELGVSKILEEIKDTVNIIKSSEISELHKDKSLLIIVDTNKTHMIQNDKILHYFNNIVVIDHHQETDQTINGINLIDESRSSACEMVSYLMNKYGVIPTKEEATIVLSGIVLDTHNFTKKTSNNTYLEAYILTECGANPKKVQYYLKENLKDYIIRNKVIMNVQVLNDKYAIAVASDKDKYKREDLAKIADTLLNFNDIKASFVLGNRIDGGIGISARSEGNVDVGSILEHLGGGGDIYNAASQITDTTLKKAKEELIKVLNKED